MQGSGSLAIPLGLVGSDAIAQASSLGLPALETLPPGLVYVAIFTLVFVESALLVGFFLPGDSVLFAAGALAALPGSRLSLPLLCAGIFVAAVIGDQVGYGLGRRLGRPYLSRRVSSTRAASHLAKTEAFYSKYGAFAIVAARFIPWVRTFTPFVAGVAEMRYRTFAIANVLGALIWGIGLTVAGYASHRLPWVQAFAIAVAACFVGASVAAGIAAGTRGLRGRRNRPMPSQDDIH